MMDLRTPGPGRGALPAGARLALDLVVLAAVLVVAAAILAVYALDDLVQWARRHNEDVTLAAGLLLIAAAVFLFYAGPWP